MLRNIVLNPQTVCGLGQNFGAQVSNWSITKRSSSRVTPLWPKSRQVIATLVASGTRSKKSCSVPLPQRTLMNSSTSIWMIQSALRITGSRRAGRARAAGASCLSNRRCCGAARCRAPATGPGSRCAVLAAVGVDQEIVDAHGAVIGDPFEDIGRLVLHAADDHVAGRVPGRPRGSAGAKAAARDSSSTWPRRLCGAKPDRRSLSKFCRASGGMIARAQADSPSCGSVATVIGPAGPAAASLGRRLARSAPLIASPPWPA